MKYLDEFRDPKLARSLLDRIHKTVTKPWVIMEICGGQTHSIIRNGIDQLLPNQIELVHGPGCPVCVTPLEFIDRAIDIASRPEVIFTSFGDMLRVPGSKTDLLTVKSEGGDVRIVYSPLDAIQLAKEHPDREIVFFGVGFETTAPATAMAVWQASQLGLKNFSMLVSHVLVPPAMKALLSSKLNRVQAYLAAGHVCAVMGANEYKPIAKQFGIPIVVTGFESLDLLDGILSAVTQLEQGKALVENRYERIVVADGNQRAQELINKVYEIRDRKWRGIGNIPSSGWGLKPEFADWDAENKFQTDFITVDEPTICISGEVLQGLKKPIECPAFGKQCTPESPLGATMVSSEGACAAYYSYNRKIDE